MANQKLTANTIGILVLWLFHISGILGIYYGDQEWFISKSSVTLTISLLIFFFLFPLNEKKHYLLFFLFATIGMLAEWLGVHYGLFFGDYAYGENLGPKLDGVPYLIGAFWALLTFVTAEIAKLFLAKKWQVILLAASLMVFLDFLMEKNAPFFDFWTFEGTVPVNNYISWFVLGVLLQVILASFKVSGNKPIAINLYSVQLVFFAVFYLFGLN